MNASFVVSQLHDMGVAITVANNKVRLQPGSIVPLEMLEFLRAHKADVISLLSSQATIEISADPCPGCRSRLTRGGACAGRCAKPECVPCLCDVYHIRLDSDCPTCHAPLCVMCEGCQRAARIWREAERYVEAVSTPPDRLVNRLRKGHQWLMTEYQKQMDDAPDAATTGLFGKALATWGELEQTLRVVHSYEGCIFGEGQRCPDNAPMVCDTCAAPGKNS